jgi:hypothetical protein
METMENKTRLFNSVFEMELHLLILLSEATVWPLSQSVLLCLDYMTVYGKEFGISDSNLHGDSAYKFHEQASRNEIIPEALKKLVVSEMVIPSLDKGYKYQISDKGENFISQVNDPYSDEYRRNAREVFKTYDVKNSAKLNEILRGKTRSAGRK